MIFPSGGERWDVKLQDVEVNLHCAQHKNAERTASLCINVLCISQKHIQYLIFWSVHNRQSCYGKSWQSLERCVLIGLFIVSGWFVLMQLFWMMKGTSGTWIYLTNYSPTYCHMTGMAKTSNTPVIPENMKLFLLIFLENGKRTVFRSGENHLRLIHYLHILHVHCCWVTVARYTTTA